MVADAYLSHSLPVTERLLSNMDRNRDSDTYGCFCRPYWHDKVVDFPSAHQQIGVLPLAILYGNEFPTQSPYEGDDRMQEWCRAGIEYWASIQRRNGSFDEHYPREHSLGATAWSLWAVASAIPHLDDPPQVQESIQDAVRFLRSYDEPGAITNHQAVAASAMFRASDIIAVPGEAVRNQIERISRMQSEEGWFQEYRGADPGYHSTTLSHLAQIWHDAPHLVDDTMLTSALDFFSAFIDADTYYGAGIGSRGAQHVHPTGFEILADEFEEAARIASALREHVADRRVLVPAVVDDKHFSWLQAEFLQAALNSPPQSAEAEDVESRRFRDILIHRDGETKTFINVSKGGYMKRYSGADLVNMDRGITATIDGKTYTSNWMGTTNTATRDGNTLTIDGNLRAVPPNTLDWKRTILMRLFQHTVGRIPRISLTAKNRLIHHLITGSASSHTFNRVIQLEDGSITDSAEGDRIPGKTRSMFVPNSEFFQHGYATPD